MLTCTDNTLPGFAGVCGGFLLDFPYPNSSIKRLIFTGCVKIMLSKVLLILHPTYSIRFPPGASSVESNRDWKCLVSARVVQRALPPMGFPAVVRHSKTRRPKLFDIST